MTLHCYHSYHIRRHTPGELIPGILRYFALSLQNSGIIGSERGREARTLRPLTHTFMLISQEHSGDAPDVLFRYDCDVVPSLSTAMKRVVIGFAVVCLAVGFIPIRYLAAPQWDVRVRDEAGSALPGLYVRLSYRNYSAESESHEITLVTDYSGHAAFPSQYQASSLLQRAFYTANSFLEGVHASYGNHASVFVFGKDDYEGSAVMGPYVADWTGSPSRMASTVIARRLEGPR